ncbi:hypothetical protein ILYODFUR_006678 [Ilyodon furcidens]|uniref:Uncharacterized protein n=1 Tax=Ilyodon furcidens TaxID=33524 RepID=A0ABV0V3L3_9TELE
MKTGKTEETEETCGNQTTEETSSRAGNLELCGSFTALSTIAIQAGQSQIVASVLKSGCLIHLQLVQFQPGLCEIGSNQEENRILIQEHQQLLQKLQKHEPEVLAVVEKKQQDRLRMMRDGRRKQKEEEVNEAMKASLSEGWSLLLRLLGRRLEVLKLASDFFLLVMEFSISIDRLKDLQIKADEDKLTEVQVTYDFMRKDLLGKSLQVLTSSSVLLQRLRQLQRTEALQRRGRVLQDEEEVEESSQGSQFSRGPVLMLEELVEALQDRRRRADQAFRLQLQQAELVLKMKAESKRASTEHQLLSALQDQNVLNLNLHSGSTSDHTVDLGSEGSSEPNMLRAACTLDLQSKSWSEQTPINQPEGMEDVNLEHGSRLQESGKEPDVKPEFWLDLNSQSRDLKSGSRLDEIKDVQADLKHGSRSDPLSKSRSTEASNHGLGSRSDLKLIPASEKTKNLMASFRSGETTETRSEAEVVSLKSALQGQSRSGSEKARNLLPESSLDESTDLQTGLWLDLKTEPATKDSQSNFRSGPKNQSRSELLRSGSKEGKDVRPAFRSDETSKQQLESRSVETRDSLPGSRPVLTTRSRSHEQHTSGCDVKPGSTLDDTRTQQSGSRSVDTRIQHTGSRPEGIRNLKLSCRSENITETISEKTRNQQPESGSAGITDLHTRSRLDLKNQSSSDVPRSGSQEGKKLGTLPGAEKTRKQNEKSKTVDTNDSNFSFSSVLKSRSRSEEQQRCGSDAKPGSESELTEAQQSGSRSEVSVSGSDPLSVKHQFDETKLGLNEQQTHHQMEAQQQQEHEMFSSGYQERLMKDLNCVSELLDSCTQLDLGSELQTSRLLEHFKQAEPHFRQLDAEVEYTVKSWESLREVHACLEEVKTGAVMNEDLLELLKIQQTVKDKIQRSELILNLSRSFHLTAKQLELLLQSEPTSPVTGSTGLHGSREAELGQLQEAEQQIQNLLKTTSTMRTDICAAVSQSNWAGFQVEQLEVRLGSLDSLCESWLNKAAQCEEELRREQLTHLLHEDITQAYQLMAHSEWTLSLIPQFSGVTGSVQ